jgi:hypothetical protein
MKEEWTREAQAEITRLRAQRDQLVVTIRDYLSEYDNPVPDAIFRSVLRDRLRKLAAVEEKP